MKKTFLCMNLLFVFALIVGCSEQEKGIEAQGETVEEETAIDGEFLLGELGADFKEQTYHLVVPIEWTGKSPIKIKSIELIKHDEKPVTYEEDGIEYEVFGADPLKRSGMYTEPNIGDVKDIKDLEIDGEGKIVFKLSLKNVKEDSNRRLKIQFNSNGEESEQIVEWKTLESLTTESK